MDKNAQPCVIVGLDIKDYSRRKIDEQIDSQEIVGECIVYAIKALKVEFPSWIDAGDGGFALFRDGEKLTIEFLKLFYSKLAQKNKRANEESKVQVRTALHSGHVVFWNSDELGKRYAGNSINDCARLLSAMPRTNIGQVVCSATYRENLVSYIDVAVFDRLKDIQDKHGNVHELHNVRVEPGFGIKISANDRHENLFAK